MPARTKARRRALEHLYAAEMRGEDPIAALDRVVAADEGPANPYTAELIRGVAGHAERIDEILGEYAEGWSLSRMPAVDRNALRLGVYELLYVEDVPDPVALSEALGLVRELSTDASPQFVNGVLGHIQRDKDSLTG